MQVLHRAKSFLITLTSMLLPAIFISRDSSGRIACVDNAEWLVPDPVDYSSTIIKHSHYCFHFIYRLARGRQKYWHLQFTANFHNTIPRFCTTTEINLLIKSEILRITKSKFGVWVEAPCTSSSRASYHPSLASYLRTLDADQSNSQCSLSTLSPVSV